MVSLESISAPRSPRLHRGINQHRGYTEGSTNAKALWLSNAIKGPKVCDLGHHGFVAPE